MIRDPALYAEYRRLGFGPLTALRYVATHRFVMWRLRRG